jgi:hypothetical protein
VADRIKFPPFKKGGRALNGGGRRRPFPALRLKRRVRKTGEQHEPR